MSELMDRSGGAATAFTRLTASPLLRRIFILAVLVSVWEGVAIAYGNPIMLPRFSATVQALTDALLNEGLLGATAITLGTLIKGYALSIVLALLLVALAIGSGLAREALGLLTAMFNPLPAIALLPLALLWFGLGEKSLIFVICHSVIWPFALALLTGFESVPETQRLVGRNYGLRGLRYVFLILVPAALPHLLSGLKIGWAFAWRTLIAAELVFGVSSSAGGLGWFIFQNRNELFTDKVFAGLTVVILIGLLVEVALFRTLESRTVRRWGMQR